MKKVLIILSIIILVIGAVAMTIYRNSNEIEYASYIPKDQLIDLTFENPAGWVVFERRGEYGSFIQAQILEDLKDSGKDKDTACSIVINIYPKAKAQFVPLSAQGLADDIKKKRLTLKGSELLSSSNTSVAGIEATDDKLSYAIFKIPLQADSKPIPIIERIVCFQKGDNFYTIRIEEGKETFEAYNKIFNRILQSINFRS